MTCNSCPLISINTFDVSFGADPNVRYNPKRKILKGSNEERVYLLTNYMKSAILNMLRFDQPQITCSDLYNIMRLVRKENLLNYKPHGQATFENLKQRYSTLVNRTTL